MSILHKNRAAYALKREIYLDFLKTQDIHFPPTDLAQRIRWLPQEMHTLLLELLKEHQWIQIGRFDSTFFEWCDAGKGEEWISRVWHPANKNEVSARAFERELLFYSTVCLGLRSELKSEFLVRLLDMPSNYSRAFFESKLNKITEASWLRSLPQQAQIFAAELDQLFPFT